MKNRRTNIGIANGFVLPTVMISSVIMLALLATGIQLISAQTRALESQYYQQIAREAAQAGSSFMDSCMNQGVAVPVNVALRPNSTCTNGTVSGMSSYIIDTPRIKTTFSAKLVTNTSERRQVAIIGETSLFRKSDGAIQDTFSYNLSMQKSFEFDPVADRASKRFWYFGIGGGLDFGKQGTNRPTAINSGGTAYEGSTVVSDEAGNLVFWTDGRTVWNKNKTVAYNSTGLLGSASATQAAVAFPLNQSKTRYGIVSNTAGLNDSEYGTSGSPSVAQKDRLFLSIYDTTLDNGNGGIDPSFKNVDIAASSSVTALRSGIYSAEAMNAMPNQDGGGYWVYTYSGAPYGNRVIGFLIGIDGTLRQTITYLVPTAPLFCGQWATSGIGTAYGTINFSSDYSKMLLFIGTSGCTRDSGHGGPSGAIYLLQTNSQTGALNQLSTWRTKSWYANTTAYSNVSNAGYSADFSPDERFVYVTQLYPARLTRYDITVSDPATTQHSLGAITRGATIGVTNNIPNSNADWYDGGQVRRGPDGRVYISNNAYVGTYPVKPLNDITCITNPNAPRYASAATLGIELPCASRLPAGTYSWYGLPQMVTSYRPKITYY